MISFRQKGDFSKVTSYFERLKETMRLGILDKSQQQDRSSFQLYPFYEFFYFSTQIDSLSFLVAVINL